jgi:hypothetical protein
VRDSCGCCDVCARSEGETCGGLFYNHGKCGNGLNCVRRRANSVKVLGENDLVSGVCERGEYLAIFHIQQHLICNLQTILKYSYCRGMSRQSVWI